MMGYRSLIAAVAASAALQGCGDDGPKPDPAAVDAHLNRLIADEERERQRLVAAARAREAVRMRDTESNAQNSSEASD